MRIEQAFRAAMAEHHITVAPAINTGNNPAVVILDGTAVVDFTFHTVTLPLVELTAKHRLPYLVKMQSTLQSLR